eukprot:TRINITY_DN1072_c0_g1_i1.p1 TRINITY_DN1072_c0_g1~~TRINITY_DN1072_c0_g1_i1.p1  ORF type:complete len:235 (+),score=97.09 TRINITY_DN1072_c0_g1_i1:88-792(+)
MDRKRKVCAKCGSTARQSGSKLCASCERRVCKECQRLTDEAGVKRKCTRCEQRATSKASSSSSSARPDWMDKGASSSSSSSRPRSNSSSSKKRSNYSSSNNNNNSSSSNNSSSAKRSSNHSTADEAALRKRYKELAERVDSFKSKYKAKLDEKEKAHKAELEPQIDELRALRASIAKAQSEQRAKVEMRTQARSKLKNLENELMKLNKDIAAMVREENAAAAEVEKHAKPPRAK